MFITTSELCGFGIGFGIGRKYQPITVSVSVSGRNQNSGFGRSLVQEVWEVRMYNVHKVHEFQVAKDVQEKQHRSKLEAFSVNLTKKFNKNCKT